jgi:hypothetical protein
MVNLLTSFMSWLIYALRQAGKGYAPGQAIAAIRPETCPAGWKAIKKCRSKMLKKQMAVGIKIEARR